MFKAILLPNMTEFPAVSIKRYAAELAATFPRIAGPEWTFASLECSRVQAVEKFLPGKQGEAWASRAARFVTYPRMASRTAGDVFHVLDHSHANLVSALPTSKTVLTCHDIIPYLAARGLVPIPTGRLTRYTFPLLRINAMRRCRFVICVSEATRQDLIEHGKLDPDQLVTIHNGVNAVFQALPHEETMRIRRERRAQHGLPEDARIVLQVGTANRYKNTPTLLRAMKHLLEDPGLGRNVYLLRAGADLFPDEETLVQELGIRDRVVLVGRVKEDHDLADYYRAADVFAFPSLWEGFGWPPIEAMACGTPSVVSNVASLPEVIGDAGITVPPQDDQGLAEGLHRILIDDTVRDSLRQRCLERAPMFTWERCATGILGLYERIVSQN